MLAVRGKLKFPRLSVVTEANAKPLTVEKRVGLLDFDKPEQ